MERFEMKDGTIVTLDKKWLRINRSKSGNLGRAVMGKSLGDMCIKLDAITGVVNAHIAIVILGSGLPSIANTTLGEDDIRKLPNAISLALSEDGVYLYNKICDVIAGTYQEPTSSYGSNTNDVAPTYQATSPEPTKKWTCKCGESNEFGKIYCKNCGTYR